MKKLAQSILEFSFVFLIIMSIFLSIIELSLFWRAKHSVVNIANEIIANIQIQAQNTKSTSEIGACALKTVEKSAGLLNLEGTSFILNGNNNYYTITSNFKKKDKSALSVFISINNLEKNDISAGVSYIYSGIFLYQKGKEIFSGPIQSIQKF